MEKNVKFSSQEKSVLKKKNIAMENGPFIDALPIKNGGSFHG